ncbi:hypothetical protein PFISCL1PPCAC_15321, partial [Pristionchus fissidentatus]
QKIAEQSSFDTFAAAPPRPAPPPVEEVSLLTDDSCRTNITFTNTLSRRLDRLTSFTSEEMDKSESIEDDLCRGRQKERNYRRESSVHVIYTDKRVSQSNHSQSELEENGQLYNEIADMNSSFLWDIEKSAEDERDDARSASSSESLRASRAFISMQNVATVDKQDMALHTSHSVSCVDECGRRHAYGLNVFELCEQHSYTDQLLTNIDFLCRLNFFAHRLTEQIAEIAGRDLRVHYRHQSNPRARYFSDFAHPSHSNSDAIEDEEDE